MPKKCRYTVHTVDLSYQIISKHITKKLNDRFTYVLICQHISNLTQHFWSNLRAFFDTWLQKVKMRVSAVES
jgi:hypothetical protein